MGEIVGVKLDDKKGGGGVHTCSVKKHHFKIFYMHVMSLTAALLLSLNVSFT